ncbi:MAG TPA: sensor domain-containing protein [Mycobacterium sp.]|jgi:hypothetical protein|uniref:sensor domain-containing protein n=1 Tax=Mycobacterium sp. TaxID=1785 RepID=UPI002F3F9412
MGGTVAIVLTLAACGSRTTSGTPLQAHKTSAPAAAPGSQRGPSGRPTEPPKPVPSSNIKNLALSSEDINEISGLSLSDRTEFASPFGSANDYTNPDCGIIDGITKEALGNGEFTAFRRVENKAVKGDSLIGLFKQNIAIFETSDKARELFRKAYGSLGKCNSATFASKSDPTTWKILAPGPFSGDVVTFSSLQLTDKQEILGWRCTHEVRVKNNVIVEAFFCAWANGSPAVAAAVDQISARIPPPDKPIPPTPADFLAPNKIKSVIVGVPQVGKLLGANLGYSNTFLYPPDVRDLDGKPNCSPLIGPDVNSFGVNVDYTAYHQAEYLEDKDDYQHIIDQQVATYSDTPAASRAFENALKGLNRCDGAVVPSGQPNAQFKLQAPGIAGNAAQWTLIHMTDGQVDTWRCVFNFRTQSNVLFVAKVCQYGNPADIVGQIADQMADSIPK